MWARLSLRIRITRIRFRYGGFWHRELRRTFLQQCTARIVKQSLHRGMRQCVTIANLWRLLIELEWRFAFTGLLCRRVSRCAKDGWREFRLMACAAKLWGRRVRGELREIGGGKMGGNTMNGISTFVSV